MRGNHDHGQVGSKATLKRLYAELFNKNLQETWNHE